jgi:hypothetical protein
MSMINSNDIIGNRSRDLPACSTVDNVHIKTVILKGIFNKQGKEWIHLAQDMYQ